MYVYIYISIYMWWQRPHKRVRCRQCKCSFVENPSFKSSKCFLIRGFMHKAATSTLCLSQRDHIGLRTVPPSYNCRPNRKSLILATEQKF